MHQHHWEQEQIEISQAGETGQQNLGGPVPSGQTRRVREITVRNAGTNNTVFQILVGSDVYLSFDVAPGTTVIWTSEDGRSFSAGVQPVIRTSDVTGGSTFVSASGVEA